MGPRRRQKEEGVLYEDSRWRSMAKTSKQGVRGRGGVGKRNEKMNKTCSPRPRGGRRVNHRRAGRERSEAAGRVTLNGLGMCPRAWALFGIPTITSRVTLSKSLMFWKPPFLQL